MTPSLLARVCWATALTVFLWIGSANGAPHLNGKPEPGIAGVGPRIQHRLSRGQPGPRLAVSYPATLRLLFLRVDFQPDADPQTTGDGTWLDPAYAFGTPIGSDYWVTKNQTDLANYYREASSGLLDLQITVSAAVYRLANAMSYYGGDSAASVETLAYDSILAANADIDFSQYDAILIVHAGVGEETDTAGDTPRDIWSLYYTDTVINPNTFSTTPLVVDGVTITEVLLMPQTGVQDGNIVDPLGVYAHEFGHWLGLPDLYATGGFIYPDWDGIGAWGLMGSGLYNRATAAAPFGSSPAHPMAWCKAYLGWATVTAYAAGTDPGSLSLPGIQSQPDVKKIPASTTESRQYLLLENRRRVGFDQGLPGEGLLVWLIDEQVIQGRITSNTLNANRYRPGVALIEADGDQALKLVEAGCGAGGACDDGSAGDPFPGTAGNTALTPAAVPSSMPYTDSGSANITNISSDAQGNINLRIGFGPATTVTVSGEWQCGGAVLNWTTTPVVDAAFYRVYKNGNLLAEVSGGPYVDATAAAGDSYTVAAVDATGDLTASAWTAPAQIGVVCGSSDSRCFIATAAYGSAQAPYVGLLRAFRDRYLLTHAAGRMAVAVYYRVSPPVADLVREHVVLRWAVRVALVPALAFAWLLVSTGVGFKVGAFAALVSLLGLPLYRRRFGGELRPTPRSRN